MSGCCSSALLQITHLVLTNFCPGIVQNFVGIRELPNNRVEIIKFLADGGLHKVVREGLPGIFIKVDLAEIDGVIPDVRLPPPTLGMDEVWAGSLAEWLSSTGCMLITMFTSQSSQSKLCACRRCSLEICMPRKIALSNRNR